jgi:hypothetical protein
MLPVHRTGCDLGISLGFPFRASGVFRIADAERSHFLSSIFRKLLYPAGATILRSSEKEPGYPDRLIRYLPRRLTLDSFTLVYSRVGSPGHVVRGE